MQNNYKPTIDEMLLLKRELHELQDWLTSRSGEYTQFMRRGRKFAKELIAGGNTSPVVIRMESFDPHNSACNDLAGSLNSVENWIDDYVDMLFSGHAGNSLYEEMKSALQQAESAFSDLDAAWEKGYLADAKHAVFRVMDRLRNWGMTTAYYDGSVYRNYYQCSECGTKWSDVWSCSCNDKCVCGAETVPAHSVDVDLPSEPQVALYMKIVKSSPYESVQAAINSQMASKTREEAEWYVLNKLIKDAQKGSQPDPRMWQALVIMLTGYYDLKKIV